MQNATLSPVRGLEAPSFAAGGLVRRPSGLSGDEMRVHGSPLPRRPNTTSVRVDGPAVAQGEMTRAYRRRLAGCICFGMECLATGCPACYFLHRPGCVILVRIESYAHHVSTEGLELSQETLRRLAQRLRET